MTDRLGALVMPALPGTAVVPAAGNGPAIRTLDAPPDRVYAVARSVLKSLGVPDKEEDLETDDRSVERRILDEIGRSL